MSKRHEGRTCTRLPFLPPKAAEWGAMRINGSVGHLLQVSLLREMGSF